MKAICCTFFLLLSVFLTAQTDRSVPSEQLIVQLAPGVDPPAYFANFIKKNAFSKLRFLRTFSEYYHLSTLSFDSQLVDADQLIASLKKSPKVISVSFDVQATLRDTPNDPEYFEQWDMDLINAPEVWDFTTGGVTALGDTIVIANMEACDPDHEDMIGNLWFNYAEVPGDNIDNDNNGYTDDYFGYNSRTQNDQHSLSGHGTSVSGIIAARGDNGVGVTGVNWNTKLMIVSNQLFRSEIIAAYEYVLDIRTQYNDSNGAKGAFVVATNASFGFDKEFPEDFPESLAWCDLLERLGQAGVISVVAPTNDNINIDELGDMPSVCPSDYIIGVTDTDQQDIQYGGFSATHIDLSAPGRGSFTIRSGNRYGEFSGTSAATPHVTGAVGLLYSAPCVPFAQLAKNNPSLAARNIKQFILDGVRLLPDLTEKTVSGGRLDLEGALAQLQSFCGGSVGQLAINTITPNPAVVGTPLIVTYQTPDEKDYTIQVYDVVGRLVFKTVQTATTFGSNLITISTGDLVPGVYHFTVQNSQNIKTEPFVVRY